MNKEKPTNKTVRFYDFETKKVINLPVRDLTPDCVEATIDGLEGVYWVNTADTKSGPIRHPPFAEATTRFISELRTTFAEHYDLTQEQWEDGFRRDQNPDHEIALWRLGATIYHKYTLGEKDAAKRKGVWDIVIGAMTTANPEGLLRANVTMLPRKIVKQIIADYQKGRAAFSTP